MVAKKSPPYSRDSGGFALVSFGLRRGCRQDGLGMVVDLWIALEVLDFSLKGLPGRDRGW